MKRLLLLSCVFCSFTLFAGTAAIPRVALIPLGEQGRNFTETALAGLSEKDTYCFLERDQLEILLSELKLKKNSLTDRSFGLRPEQMKTAELFALSDGRDLVIFDAGTGVRLLDRFIDSPDDSAAKLNDALTFAVAKQRRLKEGKTSNFAFVPLVSAYLSESEQSAVAAAERKLIRILMNRPETLVLERSYLKALLEEPGKDRNKLTRNLWGTSILVRLSASPGENGKIRFSARFTVPGRGRVAEAICQFDPKQSIEAQMQTFFGAADLTGLKVPKNADRSAEAANFAIQASFALEHRLTNTAITAAQAAAALDPNQEMQLCTTLASACEQLWGPWGSLPPKKVPELLTNFEKSLAIAKKYNYFPFQLWRLVDKLGYVSKETLKGLTPEQQKKFTELMDDYFAARHNGLKPWLEKADKGGTTPGEKLLAFHHRGQYLHIMGQACDQQWNYAYLERYILPQMPIYLAEMKTLLPELRAYFATPKEKRDQKWPELQSYELQLLQRSSFGAFFNRKLNGLPEPMEKTLLRLAELFESAPLTDLAIRGADIRRAIQGNSSNYSNDPIAQAQAKAFDRQREEAIVRFFEEKELIGDFVFDGGYFSLDNHTFTLDNRLKIWKIAAERYHYYHIFRYNNGSGDVKNLDEARRLHSVMKTYFEELRKQPQLLKQKEYLLDEFENGIAALEKRYPELNPNRRKWPQTICSRFVKPLEGFADGHVTQAIPHDGKIYLGRLGPERLDLLVCDPKRDFRVDLLNSVRVPNGWNGWSYSAVLTNGVYAVQEGPRLHLLPLDGSVPETVDFSKYYNNWQVGIWGGGNKLYLSYGQFAGYKKPGTLLEYDLTTKQYKVLVSTLDRSVRWPLNGLAEPYHVKKGCVDPAGKRFYTAFPEEMPNGSYNNLPIRVWAYEWEKGIWTRITDRLPIRDGDCGMTFEDGALYLTGADQGYSLIRVRPGEKPQLLLASENWPAGRLLPEPPSLPRYDLDLSAYIRIPGLDPKLKFSSMSYRNGILFDSGKLVFLKEKLLYRHEDPQWSWISGISPEGFIYGWSTHGENIFYIGQLKTMETMRSEMKP